MRLAVLSYCSLLLLGGCQAYRADPPDLVAHAAAVESRQPDAPSVQRYAASLARLNAGEHAPFDLADGVTAEEAQAIALLFNPGLRVARLEARVPRLGAQHAGLPEDPEFSLDLLRIVESVSSPWILGTGLAFTIPVSGRLRAERAHAFAEADAATCAAHAAERAVLADLRAAWNTFTATGERIALVEAHLASLAKVLPIAQAQREAEQIGRTDVRVLELDELRRQGELASLRAEHEGHALALKRLMGLAPNAALILVPGFSTDPEVLATEAEHARLRASNADLAAAHGTYKAAEHALRVEIRKQYPDLKIGPVYEREEGQSRLGASGGASLPLWNRNRRAIAERRAARDAARGAYHARYESLVADLAAARADVDAAVARVTWLTERVAPLADRQLSDLQNLGELGDMDVLILKDALAGVLETKFQILEVRLKRAQAAARIRALVEPYRTPTPRSCLK